MSSAGSAYLFDVVRSPRGKARADGGLAQLKPQELVRQLCASLDARLDDDVSRRAEALLLGCVGQIGAQGGNIALVSKLHSGLPDQRGRLHVEQLLRVEPDRDRPGRRDGELGPSAQRAGGRRRDDVARSVHGGRR